MIQHRNKWRDEEILNSKKKQDSYDNFERKNGGKFDTMFIRGMVNKGDERSKKGREQESERMKHRGEKSGEEGNMV